MYVDGFPMTQKDQSSLQHVAGFKLNWYCFLVCSQHHLFNYFFFRTSSMCSFLHFYYYCLNLLSLLFKGVKRTLIKWNRNRQKIIPEAKGCYAMFSRFFTKFQYKRFKKPLCTFQLTFAFNNNVLIYTTNETVAPSKVVDSYTELGIYRLEQTWFMSVK